MNKKIIFALLLVLMIFVYGCARGGSPAPSGGGHAPSMQGQAVAAPAGKIGTNRGDIAPDFTIKTIDGKTLSLSELTSDKPTVLYFFATWCPNCARDLDAVKDVYPKYSDKVNFLAIDIDQKESDSKIADYKQRMGLPDVYFAGGDRNLMASYNVVYTTTKYFLGKNREILNKGVGGVDKNTWEQIFKSLAQ